MKSCQIWTKLKSDALLRSCIAFLLDLFIFLLSFVLFKELENKVQKNPCRREDSALVMCYHAYVSQQHKTSFGVRKTILLPDMQT